MLIEIQHETRLRYARPVTEWLAELRVEPLSDDDQSCQTFALAVSQPAGTQRYEDGFGNRVHHFNLMVPNLEVRVLAASVVETHPRSIAREASRAAIPVDPQSLPLEVLEFVGFRGPVRRSPRLEPALRQLKPAAQGRAIDFVQSVMAYIYGSFQYARAVTHASSPIDDVLEKGKGVCQDFAHLMIAILRGFGMPARYVSGYIHRPNKESQSHAWCEGWIPDTGWIGVDPTNNCFVDEHFVKVAYGRDFTDVPPNKGTYRGDGDEKMLARVETRELSRLPTLGWLDRLPPLDVPLTAIRTTRRAIPDDNDDQQQQQQ